MSRVLGSRKAPAAGAKAELPSESSPASSSQQETAEQVESLPETIEGAADNVMPRIDSPSSVDSNSSIDQGAGEDQPLECPICQESMVTLLQLNRHLDDVHTEMPKGQNEQIMSWFKKKVEKAKQLQPVTNVLHTGLQRLDLFDNEESSGDSTPTHAKKPSGSHSRSHSRTASNDISVTRKHWQKAKGGERCSDLLCDKVLGSRNGQVNCRQCGKLFCSEHTMYEMKLSVRAKPDPVNGVWCRVCETCYKSRPGYNDNGGTTRDRLSEFALIRTARMDALELETNRLEKRMIKLIELLRPYGDDMGILNYSSIQKRKNLERSVASWEDDKSVDKCPICGHKFGYTLRKHHCRVCGRVVCASHVTECSNNVQLSILADKLEHGVAHVPNQSDLAVRICRLCRDTVFGRRNFKVDMTSTAKPPILKHYEALSRLRRSIELIYPRFQAMLEVINDPFNPPPHETLQEATHIRKRLMDLFFQFDSESRKLLASHTENSAERRMQRQIYAVSAQFLQENMLPLKALPRALKHARQPSKLSEEITTDSPSQNNSNGNSNGNGRTGDANEADSMGHADGNGDVAAKTDAEPNYNSEQQQQLSVLEEQKVMLSDMLKDAKANRRLDEVKPLEQSFRDIEAEIHRIKQLTT